MFSQFDARRISGASVIVFLFLLGAAGGAEKFKPFKLKDLDGKTKTLQDFSNKATLVSFFFPSCTFCNAEFPHVQRIYDKYRDKGLSVVWINLLPEENQKIPKWQEKYQFTVPVLIGGSQSSLQRDYKLKITPTHYLLDEQGNVVSSHSGYAPGDEKVLESEIEKALGVAP